MKDPRQTTKGKKASEPALLTADELAEMRAYLNRACSDEEKEKLPLELRDPSIGIAGTLREVKLLRLCDDAVAHMEDQRWRGLPPRELCLNIFKMIFNVAFSNDADFARRLAILLEARGEGKKICDVPPVKLGIKQGRGRKVRPSDWIHVVPDAVMLVMSYRLDIYPPDSLDFRHHRITREEVIEAIKSVQHERGFDTSVKLSYRELSTWITRLKIRQFMHNPHRESKGMPPNRISLIVVGAKE